ncbi:type VI secretion system tube protein Hcp [Noviherbaspirillum sp.]|uniref:Hcp family type VI secretion system effector n=1 Tax=Noviherbaspirillum sp. TaxID=1926288 RepID=UPI002D3F76F9|nr:type VI secretion system tube protein Hcp [Noviherbaspirillum sp.]HZW19942.1 type VI secretion system tube protein Hcp [Noviherbaspirillum sp.]
MGDCFIQFDQITGEAVDADYKGAIMVTGWNWGVNWHAEHNLSGKGTGRGDVREFRFTHLIDTASPALMARCVAGKEIPTAKLSMRRAGGAAQLFATIRFERVRLTNVEMAHDSQRELPEEAVAFTFQRVTYEYAAQASSGGVKGGWVPFSWSAG